MRRAITPARASEVAAPPQPEQCALPDTAVRRVCASALNGGTSEVCALDPAFWGRLKLVATGSLPRKAHPIDHTMSRETSGT